MTTITPEQARNIPDSMFTELKPNQKGQTLNQSYPGTEGTATANEAMAGADHTKESTIVGEMPSGTGPSISHNPTGQSTVNLGAMLEGKLTVELFDQLIPSLLVTALYYFKIKLRKTELQMTVSEKNIVAPILQQCLNSINLNFNSPWQALAVVLTFIYGSKVIEKGGIAWLDKQTEKKAPKEDSEESKEKRGRKKRAPETFIVQPKEKSPEKPNLDLFSEGEAVITDNALFTELKPNKSKKRQ